MDDLAGAHHGTAMPNDLGAFWMPFTDNRGFKAHPRMLVRAEGMYYTAADGRQVLDGCAGLWCVNAGHGRREIVEAIRRQAGLLDFAPTFQMGHPMVFEAASRLAAVLPDRLPHVFFTNSGSESADTAMKMALAYHRARGQGQRVRFVGRARGYHGVGFGGMSVGGIGPNRRQFGALLTATDHLPHTHSLAHMAFSRGQPEWGAHLADALEPIVSLHGADTIAAVIVEPVAGSTGVLVPPVGYLERLRALCNAHGILLIFDEVITGFGRVGANFGCERFGVLPDILTMAKGLTNAAVPMGAVAASGAVHDAITDAAGPGIEFFHGYTYSGHPLAAAAAIAAIGVMQRDDLPGRVRAIEAPFSDALHALRGTEGVVDVRAIGLMGAVELAPFEGRPGARGMEVFHRCFDEGVLVRVTGDTLALSPPLIVSESEIGRMTETLRAAVRATA